MNSKKLMRKKREKEKLLKKLKHLDKRIEREEARTNDQEDNN